ncbi:MAG: hypothetical protein ACI4OR_04810 [Alphaproteobacteria bacterium]
MKKILFGLLFFLGACGFSPLYQKGTGGDNKIPVKVAPISNQYGFTMRQVLQSKFGSTPQPLYTLTVSAPVFSSWDQTIDDKNFATMMGITGTVKYQLTNIKTHQEILNSSTSLTSSYSVVKDPYATTIAERKIKKELAEQLAEQVSLHVFGTLAEDSK